MVGAMSAALECSPPVTLEEFLAWEEFQEVRHEWDGVQPFAMVGGSFLHSELATRLSDILRAALRGGPCTVVRADLRVYTAGRTRIRYPDLVVTCAPLAPGDREVRAPRLILEVLSESTTAIDRGVKRREYAALPSLDRYVMLAQEAPLALVCARTDGFVERAERRVLALPEFAVSVPIASLYEGLVTGPE
jgi:Uma2 family endonuclease